MEQDALVRVLLVVVVPVEQTLGVPLASCRRYMASRPVTSTSQALGSSVSLIMLIIVHGTIPKNSSSAVQH